MTFPISRPRRLRKSASLRRLLRETRISPASLVEPFFVCPGKNVRQPISAMPGICRFSVDHLLREARESHRLGIPAVLLFGVPREKDPLGKEAYARDGIVPTAVRALKDALPDLTVITDLCFCEYTDHGHCGVVKKSGRSFVLDNDATLDLMARTAVVQADAGADGVAPSGMIDGGVRTIRRALDEDGKKDTFLLAYTAKYASAFYGPFREAAASAPLFGDRRTYQMDPANAREALREAALDVKEGADIVMVKPALAYLDVLRLLKDRFSVPVAAYNVSGEYSMIKAAAAKGWIDGAAAALEVLTSIKRAGADVIVTYHAREAARGMKP
ncbi:MAG TPA: porphobilinogen synthase [Elusimicrobiota bacterium]|nr:porphobilinogen synthase [Elusimicrobiota bacterium]